jgi:hypothetical protein
MSVRNSTITEPSAVAPVAKVNFANERQKIRRLQRRFSIAVQFFGRSYAALPA